MMPGPDAEFAELAGPAAVLVTAGFLPRSMMDAGRWAADQLAAGDAVAGQLWRDVGIEHVDSGRLVVGDAAAELTDQLIDRLREPDDTRQLPTTWDAPFIRFPTGGDWPVGVEIAPAEGPTTAVRFILDDELSENGDPIGYAAVGALDVRGPGRLRISDPAYLTGSPGRMFDVRPGQWVVEEVHSGDQVTGLRLRHVNPFEPDPFAGGAGRDREAVAYALAESLDWDPGSPESPIRSCLLDRRGRVPVITMKDEAVYELAIAFGSTELAGLAGAPEELRAVTDELWRVQSDDDRTVDAVRMNGTTAEVDLSTGLTVTIGLRAWTSPIPVVGALAFRHPSEMHGELSTCPACGGSIWPIRHGMPTHESWINGDRDQQGFGGCVIDFEGPQASCHDCGWAPRFVFEVLPWDADVRPDRAKDLADDHGGAPTTLAADS